MEVLFSVLFGGTDGEKNVYNEDRVLLFHTNIGKIIARVRKEKELLQSELADRVEMRQPYLSAIERGHAIPTVRVMLKLCDQLGVPFYEVATKAWFEPYMPTLTGEQKGKLALALGILEDLYRSLGCTA
ncbi:MAG: helix-turn-helix transcriptional regulator [bacterium]|nr:helix-turn-helix transcriptional regulator [bacterium]